MNAPRVLLRRAAAGVSFVSFVVALFLALGVLEGVRYGNLIAAVGEIPATQLLLGLLLVFVSYVLVSLLDVLAAKSLSLPVSVPQALAAGAAGYTIRTLLGDSIGLGTAERYRLYSTIDLDDGAISRILVFTTVGTALGYMLAAGIGFARGVISAADLLVGVALLSVLLPAEVEIGFGILTLCYLIALFIGNVSRIPGGLGVFELVALVLVPAPAIAVMAALVWYRILHVGAPLLAGVLVSAALVAIVRLKGGVSSTISQLRIWVPRVLPPLLSVGTFAAGVILLLGGAIPTESGRLSLLGAVFPIAAIEASYFVSSLFGAALLVVGYGLRRRLNGAYLITGAFLAISAIANFFRAGAPLASLFIILLIVALLPCRSYFYRRSSLLDERFTFGWIAAVAATLASAVGLGVFAFGSEAYGSELWWRISLDGQAPRALRATVGAGGLLLLFNEERSAVVPFGIQRATWVALGDPIGPAGERAELAWRFRAASDESGAEPVFSQVRDSNLPAYLDMGMSLFKLGEAALVPLEHFSLEGKSKRKFRYTIRRIEDTGAYFDIIPAETVRRDAGELMPQLREISDDWLSAKNTREKSFSVGAFAPSYLSRFPIAVVRSGEDGRPVAFANVLATERQSDMTVDLMRYSSDAPSSCMEYLFVKLMLHAAEQGYRYFSLGMAPLSGLPEHRLAPLWTRVGGAIYRQSENFHNFQGLRAFKEKFDPEWHPRYLACSGGRTLPRAIADVAALISGGLFGSIKR